MNKTGICFRTLRGAKWYDIDLIDLTVEEAKQALANFGAEATFRTILILLDIIRNGEESS